VLVFCLKEPIDFRDKVLQVERLRQKLGFRCGASGLERNGREAGDEHHTDCRIDRAGFLGKLDPVHLRHYDVGEEKVETARLKQWHSLRTATNGFNLIPDALQRALQIFTHRLIVFGKEDANHGHDYALNARDLPAAPSAFHLLSEIGTASSGSLERTPLPPPAVIEHRSNLPVLLSIPHSGRTYPEWLVNSAVSGLRSLVGLEDPLVDRLAWRAIAAGHGAVIAVSARAAIDCNRAPGEIDPNMVAGMASSAPLSRRAAAGLGIIPARTAAHGNLWRAQVEPAELSRRLDEAHEPFHAAVQKGLDRLSAAHGAALLLDCHSMPPRRGQAELVIGNRHGSSAAQWIADEAARIARSVGWTVALNEPYAGGYVVERHGDPANGVHALQLEIDRRCYCGPDLRTPGPGFDRAARLLVDLASRLGEMLARSHAVAAE